MIWIVWLGANSTWERGFSHLVEIKKIWRPIAGVGRWNTLYGADPFKHALLSVSHLHYEHLYYITLNRDGFLEANCQCEIWCWWENRWSNFVFCDPGTSCLALQICYRAMNGCNLRAFDWISACIAVIYNYDGNVPYGLRLTIGDSVQIYEECNGWLFLHLYFRN